MNVGRAFGYLFRDRRWLAKMAVAAVLTIVPVLGWIVLWGYGLRIIRGVVAGNDVPLPEWDEWAGPFADGLKAFLVVVVWSFSPTVVVVLPRFVVARDGGTASVLPLLALALGLVAGVITAAAVARVANTRSFLAGIEGGPVLRMVGRNLGDYLLVFLIFLLLAALVGCAGGIALFFVWAAVLATESAGALLGAGLASALVVAVVLPYLQFVLVHLYGQASYRAEPAFWRRPLD